MTKTTSPCDAVRKRAHRTLPGILAIILLAASPLASCKKASEKGKDAIQGLMGKAAAAVVSAIGEKRETAVAVLIRQTPADPRSGILPPGYVNVQRSIIMNLFKSRAVLEETARRLSLPCTAEQLYYNIFVSSDKNAERFYVTALSKDPQLAANLANTLSDVFVDEYKKLIRRNLEDLNDSYVKTQNEQERQLAELDEKLKRINAENNLSSIDNDIAFNNQRLLQVEDQLTRANSTLESTKQALYELQGELANTPEEIVSLREKSASVEDVLAREESILHSYEQIYAKNNPILIQQRDLVRRLRADLEKAAQEEEDSENDINRKVVVSRNPAYTQIQVAIAARRAEISALTNEIKLNNEIAVQLRARRELLARVQPTVRQIESGVSTVMPCASCHVKR